jgi:hypothetical protein
MNQPTGKETKKPGHLPGTDEDSRDDHEKLQRVEMINFSRGGMCFESRSAVGSGDRIKIRKLVPPTDQIRTEDDRGCLAEVRWCKPVSGKDVSVYRVGVEYIEPVDIHQCLKWRYGEKIGITPPLSMNT